MKAARDDSSTSTTRVSQLEIEVENTRNNLTRRTSEASAAERDLTRAHSDHESATRRLHDTEFELGDLLDRNTERSGLFSRATQGISSAFQTVTSVGSSVASVVGAVGSELVPAGSASKEGPLSGRGDTLYAGETTLTRLADGLTRGTPAVVAALQPVLNTLAGLSGSRDVAINASSLPSGVLSQLQAIGVTGRPGDGRESFNISDIARRLLQLTRGAGGGSSAPPKPAPTPAPAARTAGADLLQGGLNPDLLRRALDGAAFRIEDDGRGGLARIVNRQNRKRAGL